MSVKKATLEPRGPGAPDFAGPQTDPHNANRGTVRGQGMVERSLRNYGPGRSILLDRNGVAIAGNKTLEAAMELDLPIEYVHTTGDKLIAVVRDDLDLEHDDEHATARSLAYVDNRASEVGLEWDVQQLQADLDRGLPLHDFFFPDELDALIDTAPYVPDPASPGRGDLAAEHAEDRAFWPVLQLPLPQEAMERFRLWLRASEPKEAHAVFSALMDAAGVPEYQGYSEDPSLDEQEWDA